MFTKLTGNTLQILESDMIFVLWEKNECFLELSISITLTHLCCHDVFEVFVLNRHNALLVFIIVSVLWAWILSWNQPLDLLLCWLESQSSQSNLQVFDSNVVVSISVKQFKSFSDFSLLFLSQLLLELTSCLLLWSVLRESLNISSSSFSIWDVWLLSLIRWYCLKDKI